jgi:extracellular matrix regulatory protein A
LNNETTRDRGEAERGASKPTMVNIGYGNLVMAGRVIAIVSPSSSPMRRLREEAGKRGKLLDATEGRRTRSIVLTDSDHVILSAITPETIATRLAPDFAGDLDQ